jgi:hypothetical protein
VAVGSATGFTPYPLTDPTIVGDVTGDGAIDGNDVSYLKGYILDHAARPKIRVPPGLTGISSPSTAGPTPNIIFNLWREPDTIDGVVAGWVFAQLENDTAGTDFQL